MIGVMSVGKDGHGKLIRLRGNAAELGFFYAVWQNYIWDKCWGDDDSTLQKQAATALNQMTTKGQIVIWEGPGHAGYEWTRKRLEHFGVEFFTED